MARDNYKNIKNQVLNTRGYKCVSCESTENLQMHHVVPLHVGGRNTPSNIALVCEACHKAIHSEKSVRNYKAGIKGGRPPAPHTPGKLNVKEMAQLAGVTTKTITDRIKRGKLKAEKIGKSFYSNVNDFEYSMKCKHMKGWTQG